MKSFTQLFLDYTKEAESPTSFFQWASYAAVAAVLRDNVYREQGFRRMYPNMYILLLADSAAHRKSVPLDIVSTLVNEVKNTKLIRGRSSIQAIMDDLANTQTTRKGVNIKGGSCIMIADELASFFVEDPAVVPLLTDMYDFRESYTSSLKGAGKQEINRLCVTFLAASNETFLQNVYTEAAVYGGLLGRTFFIKPDEFRKGNSLMRAGIYEHKELVESLTEISKLRGKMEFNEDAIVEYDKWYEEFRKTIAGDKTGVMGRLHSGVVKLAMILGVSKHYDLIVKKEDVEEAIANCVMLIDNYSGYSLKVGKSDLSAAGSIFIPEIWNSPLHQLTKREFLSKHWMDVSFEVLDKLTMTLEQGGLIDVTLTGNDAVYKLTKKGLELWSQLDKSGKNGH